MGFKMKYAKLFGTLALVIILALLVVAIPATPALAASLTLTPTSGDVGTTVTVTGTGFVAGRVIDIYFYYDSTYTVLKYITASSAGTISTTFTVPNVAIGTHYVRALDFDTQQFVAIATFTVSAVQIEIDPDEGPVGTEVEIIGEGFDSREDIIVEYDGDEVTIIDGDDRTDSSGEFEGTIIIIPPSTAGDHTITVTGDDSNIEAEAEFTVEPQITASPTSAPPGTEVTVTGTGFGRRSDVTIFFDNAGMTVSGDNDTDRDGSFTATFSVPALSPGTYDVEAEDEDDNTDDVEFTIAASINITPTVGSVGTELSVTGTGFSGTVTIKYDGVGITTIAAASGAFSATFSVPASTLGDHTVTASGGTGEANATFTILTSVSLTPTSGNVGTKLTVTGTGFNGAVVIKYDGVGITTTTADASGAFSATLSVPASALGDHTVTASDVTSEASATFTILTSVGLNQTTGNIGTELTITGAGFSGTVTIKYDGVEVAIATAGANGVFSAIFTVPTSDAGAHTVTASDNTNTAQITFIMESKAPAAPEPLLPEADGKAKAEAYFDWDDVTDPSGVTYTLQIASDADFTTIMLEKEALTNSEYTLTKEEKLASTQKEAPYYWRVKAVDGASNESAWSTLRSFSVGFSLDLPDGAKYALMGVGALLIGLFGFWVGRRTAYSSY